MVEGGPMRVGWLADPAPYVGGAELTGAELRRAAPEGVEVVDCPPGAVVDDLDRYVVHNCVRYALSDLAFLGEVPAFKYWNDVGSWVDPEVRNALDRLATPICCSPLQAQEMRIEEPLLIPPPVNLARFEAAAASVNGDRKGVVSVASWRNNGKGALEVAKWADERGVDVTFYGDGPFAPHGSQEVPYARMPQLLAQYKTFVFLPTVLEPFGRVVAEAHFAGCEVYANGLVGAMHWLEHDPGAIQTAASDFWREVLR